MLGTPESARRQPVQSVSVPTGREAAPQIYQNQPDQTAARLTAAALGETADMRQKIEATNDALQRAAMLADIQQKDRELRSYIVNNPDYMNNPAQWVDIYNELAPSAMEEIRDKYDQSFDTTAAKFTTYQEATLAQDEYIRSFALKSEDRVAQMAHEQALTNIDLAIQENQFDLAREYAKSGYLSGSDRRRTNIAIDRKETQTFIQQAAHNNPTSVIDQLASDGLTLDGRTLSIGDKQYAMNQALGARHQRQTAYNQAITDQYALTGKTPDLNNLRGAVESGDMSAQDYLAWAKQTSSIKPIMGGIEFANAYNALTAQMPRFKQMTPTDRAITASNTREAALKMGASTSQATYLENIVKNADAYNQTAADEIGAYAKRYASLPEKKQTKTTYVTQEEAARLADQGWTIGREVRQETDKDGNYQEYRRVWKNESDPDNIRFNAELPVMAQNYLLQYIKENGVPSFSDKFDVYDQCVAKAAADMGQGNVVSSSVYKATPESAALTSMRQNGILPLRNQSVTVSKDLQKGQCAIDGLPENTWCFAVDSAGNGIVVRNVSKNIDGSPSSGSISSGSAALLDNSPDMLVPSGQYQEQIFSRPENNDPGQLAMEANKRIEDYASRATSITQSDKTAMSRALLYYWLGKEAQKIEPPKEKKPSRYVPGRGFTN